jgi:hypothetical protein
MKDIFLAIDPESEVRKPGKSLEDFVEDLADEEVKVSFNLFAKRIAEEIKKKDAHNLILDFGEEMDIFSNDKAYDYMKAGFAVGMAYADLVPTRNETTEKILNPIKARLKRSELLPSSGHGKNRIEKKAA